MKRYLCSIVFLWFLLLVLSAASLAARQAVEPPSRRPPQPVPNPADGSPDRPGRVRESTGRGRSNSTFYSKKMTEAQKKLLAPAPEDQAAYRDFLRQPHTGLVRLMPRGQYELAPTIDASRDPATVLPILGGGAFYSFTERTHNFGPWSEISFQGD